MIHVPVFSLMMICICSFAIGCFATIAAFIIIFKPVYDKKKK